VGRNPQHWGSAGAAIDLEATEVAAAGARAGAIRKDHEQAGHSTVSRGARRRPSGLGGLGGARGSEEAEGRHTQLPYLGQGYGANLP
jgi:hypothetical protein